MTSIDEAIGSQLHATGLAAATYGDLLYGLVRALKPTVALEIGTYKGFSALCIAKALHENKNGLLHIVDCDSQFPPEGIPDILLCRIRHHEMNSVSPEFHDLLAKLEPIDFAFIDGNHSFNYCNRDFKAVYPCVSEGGIIVLHDSDTPGVRKLVNEISGQYPVVTLPVVCGIAIAQKGGYDPDRNLAAWGLLK